MSGYRSRHSTHCARGFLRRRLRAAALLVCGVILAAFIVVAATQALTAQSAVDPVAAQVETAQPEAAQPSRTPSPAATYSGPGLLPGRELSPTPTGGSPTPSPTPASTSPFTLPTSPPDIPPTPGTACTAIFPIESMEQIALGETNVTQLQAAFGEASAVGGRPLTFRFEASGCTMNVLVGGDEVLEIELVNYADLGWLLARYGDPDAAAITNGDLLAGVLAEQTALIYVAAQPIPSGKDEDGEISTDEAPPANSLIALIDALPGSLTRGHTLSTITFRQPVTVEAELQRLNAEAVVWQAPLR